MRTSKEIRLSFLEYFQNRGHQIVPSAPIVVKNDPTLMFTNAGMNQFKDLFLGNRKSGWSRVADTQKCLRVSGKHNDLEEVGVDHYHHTMFEMLGNWSFGDYFKKEALTWSWELLTDIYNIPKDRLYVTVFEGDQKEGLEFDRESFDIWSGLTEASRILKGNKKDNFWEMGDTGPCGPCSEIHVDMRDDSERNKVNGADLVNCDHPEVIEIWNNVFMEFNRKADGSLEKLPSRHVDTGMGFERLCRVLQNKKSNYDTDVFTPVLNELEKITGMEYTGTAEKKDVAFRVIADHIRAVTFCIADGQLPSNTGAGYVVRRILRRALRYGYSYLGMREPFMYRLVHVLAGEFREVFPELAEQQGFIEKVIREEGQTFLRTLSNGLDRLQESLSADIRKVDGKTAFELYDTFGFPIDLTRLIASEQGVEVDEEGFEMLLNQQKERSRKDAKKETGDWVILTEDDQEEFIGYDSLTAQVRITRYRTVKVKDRNRFELVFDITPFYAESGGQVGDTGILKGVVSGEVIRILDTQKENDLIIHYADRLPDSNMQAFEAYVDEKKRSQTANNHSATHLLHAALKSVLGSHVAQKGSFVGPQLLRFDFSHFGKVTEEELHRIETIVNSKIAENIPLDEKRMVPLRQATEQLGATALFGEKYGDLVRVITFDPDFSVELCGGTHVAATGNIRRFKIISESSVAAGVRRIEAITEEAADKYYSDLENTIKSLRELLGGGKDLTEAVVRLQAERNDLQKKLELHETERSQSVKMSLIGKIRTDADGINRLTERIDNLSSEAVKDICFQLRSEKAPILGVITTLNDMKPGIAVFASDDLVKEKGVNCSLIVRELAKNIQGGGGGQPFFATAGGKDANGIDRVIEQAGQLLNASVKN